MSGVDENIRAAFAEVLGIAPEKVVDSLPYGSPGWDSVSHMVLVAKLEELFGVMLDTTDILEMSSVEKARTILRKYGVDRSA